MAGEVGKGLGRSDRTPLSQRATHWVGLHVGKKGAWQSKEVSEVILFQAVQIQWKSATWESRAAAWHWCWMLAAGQAAGAHRLCGGSGWELGTIAAGEDVALQSHQQARRPPLCI